MDAIWTFLRLCGIVVGVATLLRLATLGFGVEYKEFFRQFMDSIADIVELGFLIKPLEVLVHGILDWLRGWNLPIPDLQPHWRPTFTLLWLLMGALARNSPNGPVFAALFGFVSALMTAILAGMWTVKGDFVLALAVVVSVASLASLAVGVLWGGQTWRERLNDRRTAVGIDTLSVMGGALAVGYVMMK